MKVWDFKLGYLVSGHTHGGCPGRLCHAAMIQVVRKNKLSLYLDSSVLLLLFGQRGDDELTCLFARMRWQVPTV